MFCAADMCSTMAADCVDSATCINSPDDGFVCLCPYGFTGDGMFSGNGCFGKPYNLITLTCYITSSLFSIDIDECDLNLNNCAADNSTCTATPSNGGFSCACNSGFTGDGITWYDLCIVYMQYHGIHDS